ncbi:MAG: 6-phosphogluconolactonase [Alphaproteobacteria bacterium]|nr:MAG: 6-phosphogluconolactonase [Alphaproteobacteria bacterium]
MLKLTKFDTREALMQAAAQHLADALNEAIARRGVACAALSGGGTPAPAYRALAALPLEWSKITFALVDERFVPLSDTASNENMIATTLSPAFAAGAQIKPMYFVADTVERAADFADVLYEHLHIDIALMGIGADGHTASWFPGSADAALDPASTRSVIAVHAPQAQGSTERLTLTRKAVARAGRLLVLIAGADKLARLEQALTQQDAPAAVLFAPGMPPAEVFWAA